MNRIITVLISILFVILMISQFQCIEDPIGATDLKIQAARSITEPNVYNIIDFLSSDEFKGRNNNTIESAQVQDYLIQQLELYQATPAFAEGYRQSFNGYHAQYHDGTAASACTGANIIGYLPGTDPAYENEIVLLGAHYDHIGTLSDPYGSCNTHPDMDPDDEICNGAADNASGVATLLEILRCFYEYDLPHPRTLVFAFWDCEEDGLVGSNYYVMEDPVFPLDDTIAYINVDMIGLTLFAGMEEGVFATSYDTSAEWGELIQSYDNKITGGIALIPVSYNLSMGASDHYNFSLGGPLLGKKAIPSIFFTSSTADGYHTVIDDMELVNINHVMLVSRIIMVMTYDVAHSTADWIFTGDLETMKLTAIPQESDIPGLIIQMEIFLNHAQENHATEADIQKIENYKSQFETMLETDNINMGIVISAVMDMLPMIGLDLF